MTKRRYNFFLTGFGILCLIILGRFFYWIIVRGGELSAIAKRQRLSIHQTQAPRGIIYSHDNYPLVINKKTFDLTVYLPNLKISNQELAAKIAPIFADSQETETIEATKSAILSELSKDRRWLVLKKRMAEEEKKIIQDMDILGLNFEENSIRDYPEASMAAHLIGFVGSDERGAPQGYFGLEGFYHQQLSGQPGLLIEESNPFGQTILSGGRVREEMQPGMNISLHLDRAVQFILEEELKAGIEKHGAKSGLGIIMNPKTGAIYGMASFPNYHPANFNQFENEIYSNPVVAHGFEPGSIFKPFIMAAGLEENKLNPETKCTKCDGPRQIGEHTIRTADHQYHPESTMTEVMINSDNVGMVFVADLLGKDKLVDYLNKFGFGQKTGIDLQEEAGLSIRSLRDWYPIDVAAASFGQGIIVTPIQLIRAFGALANEGRSVRPQVVDRIWYRTRNIFQSQPEIEGRVVSKNTAEEIKEMLIKSVEDGLVKTHKLDNLVVAGKTGTAQIPVAGRYDEDRTIGSFIGFAPAEDPKFVMLISLNEPTSSPWGANTAAPVWFNIAEKLSYYWNL